nr:phosphoadenylyl-sulfate reductase [Saprospiraceae bacterium]
MQSKISMDQKLERTLGFLTENLRIYREEGKRIVMTSSFQTQSVPLLHLISEYFREVEVLFIDTGFLFSETYSFKNELEKKFQLKVRVLESESTYVQQRDSRGLFLYASDATRCCQINKVDPLNNYLQPGDVWISGVRRDQTSVRNAMKPIEADPRGIIRLHPMLDWTASDIYRYLNLYELPRHPLEFAGYESIGCVPCTHPCGANGDRGGRWLGSQKTECGLHTENKKG